MSLDKIRLDKYLVEKGFYVTRSRAADAIKRSKILLNGKVENKPGLLIKNTNENKIEIFDEAKKYVSRAALKLIEALDVFNINVKGLYAIDIGASTGGFSQVLLERDVAFVVAIDVGHNQLDPILLKNKNLKLLEGVNARYLSLDILSGYNYNLIVCDVSFISLTQVLPNALNMAQKGSQAVVLIKPQFELSSEDIGKDGVVKNKEKAQNIVNDIKSWFSTQNGWIVRGLHKCSLHGQNGNEEYLLYAIKE